MLPGHCACRGWCVTYQVEPGESHHRDCKHWHKKLDAEVFVTRTELIVTGDPGDDESHNCDALGCTSVSHVLYRLPLPPGVAVDAPICGNCDTAVPPGCAGLFKDDGTACALNCTPGVSGVGARHCGNCADGVPGGPDNCSKCGRHAPQYSHWTPADIAAQEALAAEQAQDMQRRAEDDEHALDPEDEPDAPGVSRTDSDPTSPRATDGGAA